VKLEVKGCDLGLSRSAGTCAIDTAANAASGEALSRRARGARALAGLGFHAVGLTLARAGPLWPAALVAHWFGGSHMVAAATGYNGCPELGAIPSLVMRRHFATECGPWRWIDERLGA